MYTVSVQRSVSKNMRIECDLNICCDYWSMSYFFLEHSFPDFYTLWIVVILKYTQLWGFQNLLKKNSWILGHNKVKHFFIAFLIYKYLQYPLLIF